MVPAKLVACPICETDIDADKTKCTVCGIPRSLIELDQSIETVSTDEVESVINDLNKDIFTLDDEEIWALTRKLGAITNSTSDASTILDEVIFECPLCGTEVGEHDSKCPGCGVVFEGDDEDAPARREEYEALFMQAKEEFIKIKDIPISPTILSDLLKESMTARIEGDYTKAIDRCQEVINVCKKMGVFKDNVNRSKVLLNDIRKLGGNYKAHLIALVDAKEMIERGDIEESISVTEKVLGELDVIYQFETSFHEVKKDIKRFNNMSISIPFRDLISGALVARNSGDHEEGIKVVNEIVEMVSRLDVQLDKIRQGKEYISQLRKKKREYKSHMDELVSAKKMLEKGKIDLAENQLDRVMKSIQEKL